MLLPVKRQTKLKSEPNCCHDVGEQANLLWHTDLHDHGQPENRSNLIAFMDDASRLIVGFSFLPNKTAQSTAAALKSALEAS
jgi:hypothetical protein